MRRYSEERRPILFISYSWTSEELQKWVIDLATVLRTEWGIDVILDIWEMKAGNDMNYFMEESVRSADKVLVICDRGYQIKADTRRSSGVSTETQIISPEVYANAKQEKFIPVFYEKDENGAPFLPVYLRARLGFDLSNDQTHEENIRKLAETIYEVPRKPELGPLPKFEASTPLDNLTKQKIRIPTCQSEERIIWLLPRGFLFIYDISFREDPDWSVKAYYVRYDGEFLLGAYYKPEKRESWRHNYNRYRALDIPPAEWDWEEYNFALNFVQELRERDKCEPPQALVSIHQAFDHHVYYYGPGELMYLPTVPKDFQVLFETGELRDIRYELSLLSSCKLHDPKLLVGNADALRYDLRVAAHTYFVSDPITLSAILEVLNDFDSKWSNEELIRWVDRTERVLSRALNRVINQETARY